MSRADEDWPGPLVQLPSAELLALVPFDGVPERVPASLGDTVVAVFHDEQMVDWKLRADSALRPGIIAEFWSWRRAWSATWSLGPISNVRSVIDTTNRIGFRIGRDLQSIFDRMCTADYEDAMVLATELIDLDAQLNHLRDALTSVDAAEVGVEILDTTYAGHRPPTTLRRWAPHTNEIVLAANQHISVMLHPEHGIDLHHGKEKSRRFIGVEHVDLRGGRAVIESTSGERLRLAPAHARPLAWLAPNSIRWSFRRAPLHDVWAPLFDGLSETTAAALKMRRTIRFSSDFLSR